MTALFIEQRIYCKTVDLQSCNTLHTTHTNDNGLSFSVHKHKTKPKITKAEDSQKLAHILRYWRYNLQTLFTNSTSHM